MEYKKVTFFKLILNSNKKSTIVIKYSELVNYNYNE